MTRDDQHFRLRLPAELRELVEGAARANKRSLTAEILSRLEWSFDAGVTAEIGSDIGRAMTWADHTRAMSAMVEVTARTVRELRTEIAKLRGREDPEGAS